MAIIEFIKRKPKSSKGLRSTINYILHPQKTSDLLCNGYNCVPSSAYRDFMETKMDYDKLTDVHGIHFVQSFDPKESMTPETAKAIADRLVEFSQFNGFQIVYAVHTDTNHVHNHFVINSVNMKDGRKWHQTKQQLQQLKDYSDKLCLEFGLSIIKEKCGNYKSSGEYRAKQRGQSWKYELYLSVVNCMRHSNSQEDFITNMGKLDYKVIWEHDRKYITFTNPDGKKCRNSKLYPPERFTKEALLTQFEYNSKHKTKTAQDKNMDILVKNLKIFGSLFKASSEQSRKTPAQSLEGDALEEYLYTLEKGSLWKNLKDEQSTEWER